MMFRPFIPTFPRRAVLAIFALTVAGPVVSAQGAEDSRYTDVALKTLQDSLAAFDGLLVRVRGFARLEFEGTVLTTAEADKQGAYDRMLWLRVGWPLEHDLVPMNAAEVVLEGRFDASSHGHMGCCLGMLTDIHAMWRNDDEAVSWAPHFETRSDALEQLEFRTGWILLGLRAREAGFSTVDGWVQTGFAFTDRSDSRIPLPKAGDRITVTESQSITIVDYADTGERLRLTMPSAGGRPMSERDRTRVSLPRGARVTLAAVGTVDAGGIDIVWGRVVPAEQP